jgi:hypothetical protein
MVESALGTVLNYSNIVFVQPKENAGRRVTSQTGLRMLLKRMGCIRGLNDNVQQRD